jgi:nitrate reductase delta subunit
MGPWRRHRRATPRLRPRQQADAWQVVSLLLEYPEPLLLERLHLLREVTATLPDPVAAPLGRFLDHVAATPLADLQTDYVDTFDVTRRCCLHLTYFTHGDTRRRGVALVQFKQAYRRSGVVLADEQAELPDHLCVVLEFGAAHDPDAGWRLLNDHRVGIELLHRALRRRGSPWLDVVEALRATLPPLEGDDEVALRRLIAEGPPQEQVGLDGSPYGSHDPALDPRLNPRPAGAEVQDLGPTIPVGAPR